MAHKPGIHTNHSFGEVQVEMKSISSNSWNQENADAEVRSLYQQPELELQLIKNLQSKTASHLHYQIYHKGIKLIPGQLTVHLMNNGKVLIDYPTLNFNETGDGNTSVDTAGIKHEIGALSLNSELVWYGAEQLIKGQLLDYKGLDGLHYRGFAAGNQMYFLQDQRRRFLVDSPVQGMVFAPDPLSSANVNYGGAYIDNGDQDATVLNAERISVNFRAEFRNGEFKLENSDLIIDDYSSPFISPATSTNGVFNFTRSQDGFEDVNTFYHLDYFKRYIDSLGFSSIPGNQIAIDVHALSDADQSYYSPSELRIYMGEGGVDDAEDVDVIVHEYGHTLVSAAAQNFNRSGERSGMEEAICDYFAVSYSYRFTTNQADRVFNWDGHNPFWPGRMASSTKDYKAVTFTANIYQHTDIMASCLKEILDNTNRHTADEIVLEALFFLNDNSTFADFAQMVINADQNLNGGANRQIIKDAFVRRNVLDATFDLTESGLNKTVSISNTLGFSEGEGLLIENYSLEPSLQYRLINLNGKVLDQGLLEHGQQTLNWNLASGVYLFEVSSPKVDQKLAIKLMR